MEVEVWGIEVDVKVFRNRCEQGVSRNGQGICEARRRVSRLGEGCHGKHHSGGRGDEDAGVGCAAGGVVDEQWRFPGKRGFFTEFGEDESAAGLEFAVDAPHGRGEAGERRAVVRGGAHVVDAGDIRRAVAF